MANNKNKRYKFLQIFFIINILLTMSRNAILGLIIFYIIRMVYYCKRLTKKQIILIITTVLLLATIATVICIAIPQIVEKVNTLFIRTETVNVESGRIKVWKNGLDMISQNNSLLTGLGRFKAIDLNANLYNNRLEQFHSIYIETLVSYGIIGLIALFYLIGNTIKKVKSIQDETKSIMLAALVVYLIVSCFETTCRFSMGYVDTIFMLYFFTIPLLYSNIQKKVEGEEK